MLLLKWLRMPLETDLKSILILLSLERDNLPNLYVGGTPLPLPILDDSPSLILDLNHTDSSSVFNLQRTWSFRQ